MAVQHVQYAPVDEPVDTTERRWNLPEYVYTDRDGNQWVMPDPSYF